MRNDIDRPLLSPSIFLPEDQFYGHLKPYDRIEIKTGAQQVADQPFSLALPSVRVDRRAANPIEQLTAFVSAFTQNGGRILLLAESLGRRELMAEYLREYGLQLKLCEDYAAFQSDSAACMLAVAPLHNGFILTGES